MPCPSSMYHLQSYIFNIKESDLVSKIADNSVSGFLWIFLPILFVLPQGDSFKKIYIKSGKRNGLILGASLLVILIGVALLIAFRSSVRFYVYLSLIPPGLTFAVINAIKEEVLYRGLIFGRTLPFGFVFA